MTRWTEAELRRHQNGESTQSEADIQQSLIEWADIKTGQYPALNCLYAVPNGQVRPGERIEPGLKAGVPDLCLPVPITPHGSLYLELKRHGGRLQDSQTKWLTRLDRHGNAAAVVYGFDAARDALIAYLDGRFVEYADQEPDCTRFTPLDGGATEYTS